MTTCLFCDDDDRRLTTATWANSGRNGGKCSGRRRARRAVIVTRQRPGHTELHRTLVRQCHWPERSYWVFNHILSYAVLYLLVCILGSPGTLHRWTVRESAGFAVVSVSEYYAWCWIQVCCLSAQARVKMPFVMSAAHVDASNPSNAVL
ncbi:hypothetical protein J3F84DRAFT_195968 [Trichoderma pleuroticola]